MADDADLAAIRAFVASGGQFQTDKDGNIVAPIDPATPQAATATPAAPAADSRANETPAEVAEDNREQAEADNRRRQPQRPARKPVSKGPLKGLVNWANNVPTPGGNLALVLILLFFAFAIIPVNSGRTRLQLIWDVLTGNAELPGSGAAGGVAGISPPVAQAGVGAAIGTAIGTATGGAFLPGLGLNYNLPGTSPAATATGAGPGQIDTSSIATSDPLALLEAPRGQW